MGTRTTIDRRSMLRLMGGAGALAATGGALAACGGDGNRGSGGTNDKIVMATVSEVGQVDSDAFWEERVAKFTDDTGIEVELRTYPYDQYANSIQLLFSQGDPPHVFRSAGTEIHWPVPLVRGWIAPLDDVIDDEYVAQWPEGSFNSQVSGLHASGKLYALPYGSSGPVFPLLSNLEVLEKYGNVDAPPTTWSEFVDVAERVTTNSGGKVAGFYPMVAHVVRALQATAGPDIGLAGAGINLQTGLSDAAQQVEVVELLQRLEKAGAMVKGWESEAGQAAPQMWKAIATDQVAMSITSN